MLRQKHLDGKPLSVLGDLRLDLTDIQQNAGAWTHKECRIWKKQHPVDFIYSAQPVLSKEAELLGVLNAQHIALWSTWRKSGEEAMGTFQEMERKMISVTREQLNFNMAATVKKIGISRANLYRKVKKYEL